MAITIIKQPENVTAAIGTTAIFAVEATGDGLTYQWQYFTSSTNSWGNSSTSGNRTNALKVDAETHRNGYKYRCVITDASGSTVTTDEVTLTVAPIVITKQPTSRVRLAGDVVYYTVEAAGQDLTYQWEFKNPSVGEWGASGMTGNKTPSMTVEVTKARNGYQYRCKITDASGNVLYTDVVALIVLDESAEIGFVSSQTMTDIGDAIRETAGTSDMILPNKMPAMIRSIKGREIYSGSFLGTGENVAHILGVSLPTFENYTFLIVPRNAKWGSNEYNYYCGRKSVFGAITIDYLRTQTSVVSGYWNIDFENGTIQNDYFQPAEGAQYDWWYFEERLG